MPTRAQRAALDNCILSTLVKRGQSIKASELSEHLQIAQRDVVGRLQALKRREMVVFVRDAMQPYAAGHWNITEQGRQAIDQIGTKSAKSRCHRR